MGSARAFVAWHVPDEVSGALARAQAELRRSVEAAGGAGSWDPPGRFHATVHFLGDVEEGALSGLGEALVRAAAGHHAFAMALDGFGAFPPRGAPRVLFARVGEGEARLAALAEDARHALVHAGAERPDKPFHGHVTLARVRRPPRRGWSAPPFPGGSLRCEVQALTLFRSVLGRGGAVHTAVATAPLATG